MHVFPLPLLYGGICLGGDYFPVARQSSRDLFAPLLVPAGNIQIQRELIASVAAGRAPVKNSLRAGARLSL